MSDKDTASKAGKELAKLGAAKGGKARAEKLNPAERSKIAKEAGQARWQKAGKEPNLAAPTENDLTSLFRGFLRIGDLQVECHVLSDGSRVLTQREIVRVISGGTDTSNLDRYVSRIPLKENELQRGPGIKFKIPPTQTVAYGYEATFLVEICESYLRARQLGDLKKSQESLAEQAEIVIRACAKVGIIALIDEVTGYQRIRAKNALQLKLQAFIADEIQEWAKMFPDEFWFELARLEGIEYLPRSRPIRWGKYVMMFVYDAIDADVGRELRKKNPSPHFLQNHHQWLKQFGRNKVEIQLEKVITIMKLCQDMTDFKAKFAHVFKKSPLQMTFDDLNW